MKKTKGQANPLARKDGLIIKDLTDEMLVYDLKGDRAHCLNQTAAFVWQHCDGRTAPRKIAQLLGEKTKVNVDERLVWLALDQLADKELLSGRSVSPPAFAGLNRRQMVHALGVAAIIAVPVVTSIVAPTAAQAATCLPAGSGCMSGAQCCSGTCNTSGTSCAQPVNTCC